MLCPLCGVRCEINTNSKGVRTIVALQYKFDRDFLGLPGEDVCGPCARKINGSKFRIYYRDPKHYSRTSLREDNEQYFKKHQLLLLSLLTKALRRLTVSKRKLPNELNPIPFEQLGDWWEELSYGSASLRRQAARKKYLLRKRRKLIKKMITGKIKRTLTCVRGGYPEVYKRLTVLNPQAGELSENFDHDIYSLLHSELGNITYKLRTEFKEFKSIPILPWGSNSDRVRRGLGNQEERDQEEQARKNLRDRLEDRNHWERSQQTKRLP